jgi:hypothetical protein
VRPIVARESLRHWGGRVSGRVTKVKTTWKVVYQAAQEVRDRELMAAAGRDQDQLRIMFVSLAK